MLASQSFLLNRSQYNSRQLDIDQSKKTNAQQPQQSQHLTESEIQKDLNLLKNLIKLEFYGDASAQIKKIAGICIFHGENKGDIAVISDSINALKAHANRLDEKENLLYPSSARVLINEINKTISGLKGLLEHRLSDIDSSDDDLPDNQFRF